MTNTNNTSKTVIAVVLTLVICVALLFGLNSALAPKILENIASDSLGSLISVLPQGKAFSKIYESVDITSSTLTGVSDKVTTVYEETNGNGYVVELSTTEGYTGNPVVFLIGIDNEGKISGTEMVSYTDTKDLTDEFVASFIDKDSALADVSLIAGVTYSSSAYKNAVEDAFACLIGNGLISAGQKSDDQLLNELISVVFPGSANAQGISIIEPIEADSSYLTSAMYAANGKGCVFFAKDGDTSYLVCVNNEGIVKAYDTEGNDVTDSVNAAIIDDALSVSSDNLSAPDEKAEAKLIKKFTKLLDDENAEFEFIPLGDDFTLTTNAVKITSNGEELYGLVAKPYGYGNDSLVVYYILDSNGKIIAMTADEFILEADYFSAYDLDKASYRAGFNGIDSDSYNDDIAFISGATVTSDAIRAATTSIFESFNNIMEGSDR